jgi:hypothetical protein
MPGLLRGIARTAVISGTATATANRVSRRQANRWAQQGEAYSPPNRAAMPPQPQQQYAPPPPPPPPAQPVPAAAPQASVVDQLKDLAELKQQGILTEDEFQAQKARILNG